MVEGTGPFPSPQDVIGRENELEAISRFIESAPAAFGMLVLLGESGIGKTTLLRHARTVARERSYRVLSCRPVLAEVTLPMAALADLLEGVEEEILSSLPEVQRGALDLALMRVDSGQSDVDERAVSAAVLGVVRSLATTGPVLVAVDDLQWLDSDSSRVLGFALRRLDREPVRVLGAELRPAGRSSKTTLIKNLPRDMVRDLSIGPFSVEELDRLFQARLGALFLRPALVKLHSAAGGNPFFALEIARALQRRGVEARLGEPLPVPDDLRELVRDRLAALPAATMRAVQVASLLADPTVTAVRSATDAFDATTLAPAMDAEVVEIDGNRIRFTHPLLALVATADIPPAVRQELHRTLARVVSAPEARARHLALGTVGPDADVAETLDQAARLADARGAPSSAAELSEMARALTPEGIPEDDWRRGVDAAAYHLKAGDTARARGILRGVVEASPAGPPRARALLHLGDWEDDARTATGLLEQALGEARGDPELSARIHSYIVGHAIRAGEIEKAAGHAAAELDIAETLDRPPQLRAALVHRAETELLLGNGLRHDLIDRALDDMVEGKERLTAAFVLLTAGELDRAEAELERLRRQADLGEETLTAGTLYHLSDLELLRGNWNLASRHAEDGYQSARKQAWEPLIAWGLHRKARLDAGWGRLAEARAEAEEALHLMESTSQLIDVVVFALPVLGYIELSAGNARGAHEYLALAAKRSAAMGIREPGYLRFVPDEVEALVTLGDLDSATRVLEPFEERSRAVGRAYGLAGSARCRGQILAAQGDTQGAAAALEQALEHHTRAGEPFERGRTLLVMGEIHRRRKQKRVAREALEEAQLIFDHLPAPLWADKARDAMERLGKRPPSRWELSATEQQVAGLVATGMTTEEVAHALFISPKTVSHYLTNIYQKLGIRSRTELARKMADQQSPVQSSTGPEDAQR